MGESGTSIRDELPRATALARAFESEVGAPPEGVWGAPGRVNLIGEHTDYNEGFALPLGIEQRALVAVRRRQDDELRLWSRQAGRQRVKLSELAPGKISGWAAYVGGAAWAAVMDGARATGLDLLLDSDVPMGAGLSSSAAVECASLVAMADLWGFSRSKVQLARLAQRAEVEVAGVPCGLMDQLTSMCAGPGEALWLDFRSLDIERLALPLDAAGLELLVIDTRAPHQLADGAYAERRQACQAAARALGVTALRDATLDALADAASKLGSEHHRRARHVITENARVLAAVAVLKDAAIGQGTAAHARAASELARLGPLLSASHASLRDDFEVTVPELDGAAEAAERAGALGARMIGGGFGGSVLALVRRADFDTVAAAVQAAFKEQRWTAPRSFRARAGSGAGRLR
jgi:galactokinase